MRFVHRSVLIGAAALVLLSGCDFSSPWGSSNGGSEYGATGTSGNTGGGTGTGSGTGPVGGVGGEGGTQGTDDTVIAASSTPLMSVAVGASQTLSVTFNSSDGLAITGFGVSGSLGTLPAGWSGPATFTCPRVSTGSGCVLNLTYAPAATDSGTLMLAYIYVDNAGLSKVPGGTISIPYQAIAANNVVATASPSGQVNAAVGGMQSVSVTFTTDTGNATLDAAASNSERHHRSHLPAVRLEQRGVELLVRAGELGQRLPVDAELCADRRGPRHAHPELRVHRRHRREPHGLGADSVLEYGSRHGRRHLLARRPGHGRHQGRQSSGRDHVQHGRWEDGFQFLRDDGPRQAPGRLAQHHIRASSAPP